MKLFLYISLALFVSCGHKVIIDDPDEYLKDSLAKAHVKDSLKAEEIIYKDFSSNDLASFQLKGRVKKVTIFGGGFPDGTLEFDKEGNLIARPEWLLQRNGHGKIRIIAEKNRSDYKGRIKVFLYNVDGHLKEERISDSEFTTNYYLKHTSDGWPLRGKTIIAGIKGEEKYSFRYPKVDKRGNWTISIQKRPGYEYRTRRRIVYW